MRTTSLSSAAALALLLAGPPLTAAGHLVAGEVLLARLDTVERQRQADVGRLQAVLARPQAVQAARALGQDAGRLRGALPLLSDEELRSLAQRAAALESDPAAGLDDDIRTVLVIFLIAATVVLVLQAAD